MYNNSFWDTVKGHEMASVLENTMLELSDRMMKEKKQETFLVFRSNVNSFLTKKLEEGYRYIDAISQDENRVIIILSH